MVRMGIGLYGIDSANTLELKEVSTLKSAVAQIKTLKPGESVSYGRSGVVHRDSRIATIRLGYADGYPRSLGNGKGKMLVNGQLAPTIGNICMDMTMIDITDIENIQEGDELTVFGKGLSVAEVARWAETIPYELLTGVSQRVKRVYFQE
jgi:alanine racemase